MERPQGYFVLFVGRRYYLRPNPLRSPPLRPLERAKRYWNSLWPTGTEPRLYLERRSAPWNGLRPLGTPAGLVKNHYYTRATHGIVEVMWSNRGAFVERGFLSGGPENLDFWGEEEKRFKSLPRDETFVSYASFLGPPKISDFWGEQRP